MRRNAQENWNECTYERSILLNTTLVLKYYDANIPNKLSQPLNIDTNPKIINNEEISAYMKLLLFIMKT